MNQSNPLVDCLDPVDHALLALLRARGVDDAVALPVDPAAVDWSGVVTRALRLGVAPLVNASLQRQRSVSLPPAAAETLRAYCGENIRRNFKVYQALRPLLSALQSQHIEAIVLKGAYLAQLVYQDIALRSMSDVDLMVRPAQVETARQVLVGLGYVPVDDAAEEAPHHAWYRHPGYGVDVELHWALVSSGDAVHIDHAGLWARARSVAIAGMPVRALAIEDTLLHLIVHTTLQHVFHHFGLRGLCDVQQVIHRYRTELDWPVLCDRARAWACERSTYLVLLLARELLGAAVPAQVLATLQPSGFDPRMQGWAAHRLLGKVDDMEGPWSTNLGEWELETRLPERIAVARQVCFPPRKRMAQQFNVAPDTPWIVLYYPWRWMLLMARVGQRLARRRRGASTPQPVSWREREMGRTALVKWLQGEG